jgi:succinate dehydrogenase/fumarate reductase flavoprotein subunit
MIHQEMINTDVLIIGGGGAAFRAAIGAREMGLRTLLISKGPLARCGATPMAGADFTLDGKTLSQMGFPGEPRDSPEAFFNDIVFQGFHLNNQKLLEQYVSSAPGRLQELLDWGVKPKSTEERAIYTTGLKIIDVLNRKAKSGGVAFLEDLMMLDLIVRNGQAIGAVGLEVKSGRFVTISARSVVLATGGWHKAFWPTTGSRDLSGDGIAMASRAGARLGNMEFITFACPILLGPPYCQGSLATYIMILTGGGRLINREGNEFLKKYDPVVADKGTHMEWNKLFLSIASAIEVREGQGSPLGGVYYDQGEVPWSLFEAEVTKSIPNWKYKALDLKPLAEIMRQGGSLEVGGVAEYFDGGIVINASFETEVDGLFAAGECALGPFGANRVCSAITEMLVQGADAGKNAADYALGHGEENPTKDEIYSIILPVEQILERKSSLRPAAVRREVQMNAHQYLGPVRNQKELEIFLTFLTSIKEEQLPEMSPSSAHRNYNKEWIDVLELNNMVLLLECSVRSALMRTESRGVHYREDYPYTDNNNWLKESLVTADRGYLEIEFRNPDISTLKPEQGITPYFDMLKNMMMAHSEIGGHH